MRIVSNIDAPSERILALAIALVGVSLRVLAAPPFVGDVDSVNFAAGLARFDPLHQAPHWPGYPTFMLLARLVRGLGVRGDVWALALPAMLLWPLAAVALHAGLRRHVGGAGALGAVIVTCVAPGGVLVGGWPGSDGLGLALLCLAIGAVGMGVGVGRGWPWLAVGGVLGGLLLGVRLSWWPLVIGGLVVGCVGAPRRAGAGAWAGFAAGVASWCVWLVHAVGFERLWALSVGFVDGHFRAWGNSIVSASQGWGERLLVAASSLFLGGLGIPITGGGGGTIAGSGQTSALAGGVAVACLVACGVASTVLSRRTSPRAWGVYGVAGAYLVWVVVCQNVEKPRHFVALLPLLGAVIGVGFARLRASRVLLAGLCAGLFAAGAQRAVAQGDTATPAVALAQFVAAAHPAAAGLQIFAGQEGRVVEHFLPGYRVARPANGDVLAVEAERLSALGVEVWISSGAPGVDAVIDDVVALQSFEYPGAMMTPREQRLVLYRFGGALAWQQARSSRR